MSGYPLEEALIVNDHLEIDCTRIQYILITAVITYQEKKSVYAYKMVNRSSEHRYNVDGDPKAQC